MVPAGRWVAGLVTTALTVGVLGPVTALTPAAATPTEPPTAAAAPAAQRSDRTSAKERRRVDRVKTPKLRWYTCYGTARCATTRLPRDYDKPKGATVEIALLKRPARDAKRKIGTLFLNPGGPGGSGVELAYFAEELFGARVLDRFDMVGFDPRGTNYSSQVKCFSSERTQLPVARRLASRPFPYGRSEEATFIAAYDKQARACSTRGKPLSRAVSTAEVARDLDVLRRAVGDRRLSYFGFSYGSYLGQVYANMFPDRVRSVVIDGVLNPRQWAGTRGTKSDPIADRLRSADGATKALREILLRCQRAGATRCSAAAHGNPVTNFDLVAERLKRSPLVEVDAETGDRYVIGYSELVGAVLGSLYSPYGWADVDFILTDLLERLGPAAARSAAAQPARRPASLERLTTRLQQIEKRQQSSFARAHLGFPYDNSLDTLMSISCTDSLNSRNLKKFGSIATAADRRAKYFGRLWLWSLGSCSAKNWTAKDEDAYRGPFTRRTANPVLVVGNYWDPATSYAGAQKVAQLLPNSRLLSSNSWGHTAYGSSACVNNAVEAYLLAGQVPAAGTTCRGDVQPFTEELAPPGELRSASELGLLRPPPQVRHGLG